MENRQRTKHRLRCEHTFRSINSFQQNIHPLRPYFGMLVLSAYYIQWGFYSWFDLCTIIMLNPENGWNLTSVSSANLLNIIHTSNFSKRSIIFKIGSWNIKERFHMHTLIGFNHFVVQVIRMGLFLVLQSGNTPLHLAVTRGQLGTVKLLLGYRPIFSIPNLVSSRVCYLIFASFVADIL